MMAVEFTDSTFTRRGAPGTESSCHGDGKIMHSYSVKILQYSTSVLKYFTRRLKSTISMLKKLGLVKLFDESVTHFPLLQYELLVLLQI